MGNPSGSIWTEEQRKLVCRECRKQMPSKKQRLGIGEQNEQIDLQFLESFQDTKLPVCNTFPFHRIMRMLITTIWLTNLLAILFLDFQLQSYFINCQLWQTYDIVCFTTINVSQCTEHIIYKNCLPMQTINKHMFQN